MYKFILLLFVIISKLNIANTRNLYKSFRKNWKFFCNYTIVFRICTKNLNIEQSFIFCFSRDAIVYNCKYNEKVVVICDNFYIIINFRKIYYKYCRINCNRDFCNYLFNNCFRFFLDYRANIVIVFDNL